MTQMRSIFFFLFLIRITQLESRQFRKFLRYVNSRGGRKRGGGTKLCAPLPSFFSFSFSSVTLHERVVLINKRRRNKAETSIISIRKYRYFYTFQRIGLLDARHRGEYFFLSYFLSLRKWHEQDRFFSSPYGQLDWNLASPENFRATLIREEGRRVGGGSRNFAHECTEGGERERESWCAFLDRAK